MGGSAEEGPRPPSRRRELSLAPKPGAPPGSMRRSTLSHGTPLTRSRSSPTFEVGLTIAPWRRVEMHVPARVIRPQSTWMAATELPTKHGTLTTHIFRSEVSCADGGRFAIEHVALVHG